ncbi:MAG TPA: hypothetical protein VGG22_10140 [Candidatus Baltobacteraceae bacterium]|jgi:hypothetical protein
MASFDDEERVRASISIKLETLRQHTPESLQRLELRDLSFKEAEPIFRRYWDLFEELRKISLSTIPFTALQASLNQIDGVLNSFTAFQNFNPAPFAPGQAQATQRNMINNIWNQWDACWSTLAPIVSYGTRTDLDISSYEQRVRTVLDEAANQSRSKLETLDEMLLQAQRQTESAKQAAQQMLATMRETVADIGIVKQAKFFRDEATHQRNLSRVWLGATIVSAILTLAFGLSSPLIYPNAGTESGTGLQEAIAKVLAFSVLSFLVFTCGRNYRATQHNVVVNTHRQNALATFEAFVGATTDEMTKNAVLLKVTEAVFNPEQTGYLSKEVPDSRTSQILEIIKGAKGD